MKPFLLSLLVLGSAAGSLPAATLLQRTGDTTFQCCSFVAVALSWTQADTWSGVQIDLELINNDGSGAVSAGSAYLTTSLGPGTTEALHEIDETVVSTKIAGRQTFTLFTGLTLGPGTYHLIYNPSSTNDLLVAFSGVLPPVYGEGVSGEAWSIEDVEAPYPPASTYQLWGPPSMLVSITGTREPAPIPEPATFGAFIVGLAFLAWRRASC